ncbi:MAG: glycosyltransferase [Acidobacteria bacterium]|nr:MAG: glycosyltransferase [Acidobacteriota bacterium]
MRRSWSATASSVALASSESPLADGVRSPSCAPASRSWRARTACSGSPPRASSPTSGGGRRACRAVSDISPSAASSRSTSWSSCPARSSWCTGTNACPRRCSPSALRWSPDAGTAARPAAGPASSSTRSRRPRICSAPRRSRGTRGASPLCSTAVAVSAASTTCRAGYVPCCAARASTPLTRRHGESRGGSAVVGRGRRRTARRPGSGCAVSEALRLAAGASLTLAAIPAALTLANLPFYRRAPSAASPTKTGRRGVSILIPARDEGHQIGATLEAACATRGIEFEVVVLDDHSSDDTAEQVARRAAADPRVRLEVAPALPAGWNGKQHACWRLADRARYEWLLFLDADVILAPDAANRLVAAAERSSAALVSGFPRQRTGTLLEHLLIPLIHFVLLGFLPLIGTRYTRLPGFGAGCGQLVLARRGPYVDAGGHRAVKSSRHDGLQLPRALRRAGYRTDLVDAIDLASCRMYRGAGEVWRGLTKNATEGMASRIGLPVWSVLLLGGQVAPFLLVAALAGGRHGLEPGSPILTTALVACLVALVHRALLAARFRQSWWGVPLHPLAVALLGAVQYHARLLAELGRGVAWKGRVHV